MKKKILAMAIVGIFLLTSLSALPVVGIEASEIKSTEGEIDLKLSVLKLTAVVRDGEFLYYQARICLKNIGAPLKKSEYPVLATLQTAEYEGEEVFNYTYPHWWHHYKIGDTLEPGEEIYHTMNWGTGTPVGSLLKVYADPKNLIPESNEDNNYWEAIGPKTRSIKSPFLNFLEQHPNMFPLLQRLLNL